MANKVPLEKMELKVLRGSKVKLESEVIREIEAPWETLEFLEPRDQRVILEKRARGDCGGQKDQGVLKVRVVLQVLQACKAYRADLEIVGPRDQAEIKVPREELVHPVRQAPQGTQAQLAASLDHPVLDENGDLFPTKWRTSLWNSPLACWKSLRRLKT